MHQNDAAAKLSELQWDVLFEKLKKDLPSILWFVLVLLSTNKNSTKFRENFSRFLVWWFTNVDTSESLRVKSGIIAAELDSWLIIDADNVRKFISGVRETRIGQKSVNNKKYLVLKKSLECTLIRELRIRISSKKIRKYINWENAQLEVDINLRCALIL